MRGVAGLVACATLLCARPVEAGLYNTEDPGPPWSSRIVADEPPVWPTPNLEQFLYVAKQLREVAIPQAALRQLYDHRIAELEAKNRAGELRSEDRVNLSAYYVRIRQPEKAIALLDPLNRSGNFMLLSNLGAAYEASDLGRAISYSEQALAGWPSLWPGLTPRELNWLYRAEKLHVALLKARQLEQTRHPGKPPDKPDALFPKVHFTRSDGSYAVNDLDAAQLGELPPDNLLLVQQLILWNPGDFRLYWLFGELLNAQGNVAGAADLFKWLVESGYGPRELRDHRAILNQARETATLVSREAGALSALLWGLRPRGATLEGMGALLNESGPFGRVYLLTHMNPTMPSPAAAAEPTAPPPARQSRNLLEEIRTIIVSFVAGCLVTLLIVIQFRETRRRLQNAGTAKTEA